MRRKTRETRRRGKEKISKREAERGIMIRGVVVEHARVGVAPYSLYCSRQGFLSTTNCRWKRFSDTCDNAETYPACEHAALRTFV